MLEYDNFSGLGKKCAPVKENLSYHCVVDCMGCHLGLVIDPFLRADLD